MNEILMWIHEQSGTSGWSGREREKLELFMAAAYAKGRDDQEAYEATQRQRPDQ